MADYAFMLRQLRSESAAARLETLYGTRDHMVEKQIERYEKLILRHESCFRSEQPVLLISAPGRSEIGGNHTDHNRGKVLAAAINLDTVAAVSARNDSRVNIYSEGHPELHLDLGCLEKVPAEEGHSEALVRGVAAGMKQAGMNIGGFDAVMTSTVASGSGLSSSAAYEVLVTGIFDALFNRFEMNFVTRAKIGQYAENVYFGKPCGLLDQMASAAGGLVTVDFKNPDPAVRAMNYDFAAKGYSLVVVATGGSHDDLTPCYAAIPAEMKQAAALLDGKDLRDVDEALFMERIGELRKTVGDRAIMRAIHFYRENRRVEKQVAALDQDRLNDFLAEINESGRSSFMYLQNVYAGEKEQGLSLALCLAEGLLKDRGAWRVHGGGFAGTTLNFVPADLLDSFVSTMEKAFGAGCCNVLAIRPEGAAMLEL